VVLGALCWVPQPFVAEWVLAKLAVLTATGDRHRWLCDEGCLEAGTGCRCRKLSSMHEPRWMMFSKEYCRSV
jgi:hypothetical protein